MQVPHLKCGTNEVIRPLPWNAVKFRSAKHAVDRMETRSRLASDPKRYVSDEKFAGVDVRGILSLRRGKF